MTVANLEQRPAGVNRDKKRRSSDQIFIVEVSRVNPWRITADAPGDLWRGNAHAAEKWAYRNLNPISEMRYHAFLIQWNDFRFRVRVIIRQEAAPRRKSVKRIRNGQLNFLDPDFQDVALLGSLDVDRAGQDMCTWTLLLDLVENVAQRLFDLIGLDESDFEAVGA